MRLARLIKEGPGIGSRNVVLGQRKATSTCAPADMLASSCLEITVLSRVHDIPRPHSSRNDRGALLYHQLCIFKTLGDDIVPTTVRWHRALRQDIWRRVRFNCIPPRHCRYGRPARSAAEVDSKRFKVGQVEAWHRPENITRSGKEEEERSETLQCTWAGSGCHKRARCDQREEIESGISMRGHRRPADGRSTSPLVCLVEPFLSRAIPRR